MDEQPIVMHRECPFCGGTHRSPFVDELERIVMECREKALPEKRGDLEAFEEETQPIRVEMQVIFLKC